MSDILTSEEAATEIGINRSRVLVLVRTGRFPGAIKKGSIWLIPREDALAYKNSPRKPGYPKGSSRGPVKKCNNMVEDDEK